MEKIKKDDLGYLGKDFQYAAVKCLFEDPRLLGDLYGILDQNCFTDSHLRQIVGTLKDKYKKTSAVPTYKEMLLYLADKAVAADDMDFFKETLDKIKNSTEIQPSVAKDKITEFMKWKYMIGIFKDGMEKLRDGWDETSYKKALKKLETLQRFGSDNSILEGYNKDTVTAALIEGDEDIVPTGVEEIDKRLDGGVVKGDIALFNAPTGGGKTTFSTILAHNAAVKGYKALQIFFEDRPNDIIRKHIAVESNTSIGMLKKKKYEDAKILASVLEGQDSYVPLSENLYICKMEDRNTTVEDIENKIIELGAKDGWRPDLIIIDYFSCLKHSSNPTKEKYEAEAGCMRKIKEKIAMKYNTAVWVMQQTNRNGSAVGSEAGKENWQGSIQATQPASIWIEMRRTNQQAIDRRCDLIFHKTRHSKMMENLYDIVFDNGIPHIETTGAFSEEDELDYKEEEFKPSKYKMQYEPK